MHQEAERLDKLTEAIVGAAIEVHKTLGPGLLESAYEACLCHELMKRVEIRAPETAAARLRRRQAGLRVPNGSRRRAVGGHRGQVCRAIDRGTLSADHFVPEDLRPARRPRDQFQCEEPDRERRGHAKSKRLPGMRPSTRDESPSANNPSESPDREQNKSPRPPRSPRLNVDEFTRHKCRDRYSI